MFQRLVFEDTAALFTIAAFITAASIYVTIAWRAIRMRRSTCARFENLPFETETPSSTAGFQPAHHDGRKHAGATSIHPPAQ